MTFPLSLTTMIAWLFVPPKKEMIGVSRSNLVFFFFHKNSNRNRNSLKEFRIIAVFFGDILSYRVVWIGLFGSTTFVWEKNKTDEAIISTNDGKNVFLWIFVSTRSIRPKMFKWIGTCCSFFALCLTCFQVSFVLRCWWKCVFLNNMEAMNDRPKWHACPLSRWPNVCRAVGYFRSHSSPEIDLEEADYITPTVILMDTMNLFRR